MTKEKKKVVKKEDKTKKQTKKSTKKKESKKPQEGYFKQVRKEMKRIYFTSMPLLRNVAFNTLA